MAVIILDFKPEYTDQKGGKMSLQLSPESASNHDILHVDM